LCKDVVNNAYTLKRYIYCLIVFNYVIYEKLSGYDKLCVYIISRLGDFFLYRIEFESLPSSWRHFYLRVMNILCHVSPCRLGIRKNLLNNSIKISVYFLYFYNIRSII